jgi:hypothetical protein
MLSTLHSGYPKKTGLEVIHGLSQEGLTGLLVQLGNLQGGACKEWSLLRMILCPWSFRIGVTTEQCWRNVTTSMGRPRWETVLSGQEAHAMEVHLHGLCHCGFKGQNPT